MKRYSRLFIMSGVLAVVGCVDDDGSAVAPPVKNALDQMQALQEAGQRAQQSAAAARVAAGEQIAPAADVPKEGQFEVEVETTVGKFTIQVNREWAPRGAHRFYRLVKDGFYDDAGFFRVMPGFMAQIGIAADPEVHAKWNSEITDDPVRESNKRGYVTFAKTGAPNSRTSQIFINFGNNARLDSDGFAPFGKVISGMEVVDRINSVYGEQPDQMQIEAEGNAYLKRQFPGLDYIKTAQITVDDQADETESKPTGEDGAKNDAE